MFNHSTNQDDIPDISVERLEQLSRGTPQTDQASGHTIRPTAQTIHPGPVISTSEAAKHLGVSRHTVKHWEELGLLTAQKIEDGIHYYAETDLNKIKHVLHHQHLTSAQIPEKPVEKHHPIRTETVAKKAEPKTSDDKPEKMKNLSPLVHTLKTKLALKNIYFYILIVLAFGFVASVGIGFKNYLANKDKVAGTQAIPTPVAASNDEIGRIVEKVSRHIILPEETPQVLTLANINNIKKDQPFFAKAKDGDRLLVYSQKVIIYDPILDKIVDVAAIRTTPGVPNQSPLIPSNGRQQSPDIPVGSPITPRM